MVQRSIDLCVWFFWVGGGVFFVVLLVAFLTSRPLFQGKDYMHQLEEIINSWRSFCVITERRADESTVR